MSYIAVDKSAFDEAIEWVNENFAEIPKYDLLRLYAFYKIANGVRHEQNNKQPFVSAFKANSIMWVSDLSIDMAQPHYSALIKKLKQMD